ncbi:ABC transporter substrate-binding protein [Microbacterium album]|nr:ABC transporter substrate-binding protein [Microbacterium album]
MSHSTRMAALAVGAVALLGIAGCTGGGGGGGGEGQERVFIQAIGSEPDSFNAQVTSGLAATMFSGQLFDTLVRVSDRYEITPGLAETWELAEDGLTLTLNLRDDVSWHDGEPFTAEDVKFNLEEIVELQTFGAPLAQRVDTVEVVDDHTAVVHLSEPYGPLLETLGIQFMIPKHIYEGTDYVTNPANMEPVGTGPMMFESYSSGEQVVFVRNPDYWEGEVNADRVVYPIMTDPNSRALALFAGEVDKAEIEPSQQDRVAQEDNLELITRGVFPQLISAMFNAQSEYLQDPEVRALVFAALDREAITERALSGLGEPATGFFPEALDWARDTSIDFDRDFPHDIDAINAGLDAAGFPVQADGFRFTLNVQYIQSLAEVGATAELAKSQLAEVGINVDLHGSASPVFTERVYTTSDFDLAFLRSTIGADPSIGVARWYTCNERRAAASNPSGICDPEIDAAAAAAVETVDRETRAEHFRALQQRARELIYYAPVAWFNGAFPTVNTSRWDGLLDVPPGNSMTPWLTMSFKG